MQRRSGMSEVGDRSFDDTVLRAVVVLGLLGVALVHFLDLFGKFRETPYLGGAYVALIVACLVVAFALAQRGSAIAWSATAVVAVLPFLGYVISRTAGLPAATDDIGNWMEPLGLASLFVEGLVALVGVYMAALMSRSYVRLAER
jgi:hypothetical protein